MNYFSLPIAKIKVNLFPAFLIFVVLVAIFTLIRVFRIKFILKNFKQGSDNEKIIKYGEKVRKYCRKKDEEEYCVYCYILAATHLLRGETAEFFKNLNLIQKVFPQHVVQMNMLFLAYFTGERFIDLINEYKSVGSVETMIKEKISCRDKYSEKIEVFRNSVTNPIVMEHYDAFIDMMQ